MVLLIFNSRLSTFDPRLSPNEKPLAMRRPHDQGPGILIGFGFSPSFVGERRRTAPLPLTLCC